MISYDTLKEKLMVEEYSDYFLARCVFHDDNEPSMIVNEKGWFKCLGCNRVGRWESIWRKIQGVPVEVRPDYSPKYSGPPVNEFSSIEDLCYQANLDLTTWTSFQWYLKMRKIDDRIEVNDLGYWKGWYSFPIYNEEGKFQTAVFRSAPHVEEVIGTRYWMKSKPTLYVPNWSLVKRSRYLFVVFGIVDALTLSRQRFPVVTSTGGQNFNPIWFIQFRVPIFIFPDKGEMAGGYKLSSELGWRGKNVILNYPEGTKDMNDVLVKYGEDEIERLVGHYVVN